MASQPQSPFSNEEYTVGWICALSVELAAAKGMMDEVHGEPQTPPAEADNNSYILGSMGKFNIVAARLPMGELGSSSATAVAREMMFTFPKVRVGLLVGIGAGIPDYENDIDIRLGDVVIGIGSSSSTGGVVVYDFGKALADGSFESLSVLNRPPRSLSTAVGSLQTSHEMEDNRIESYTEEMLQKFPVMRKRGYSHPGQSADRLFHPEYLHTTGNTCAKCDSSAEIIREPRLDGGSVIHYGTIASGNVVVKDPFTRDLIRDRHGAICLEMEAAGLMNNFPCIVVRGISDYADSHKNDRWQPFAAATAAACAKELLEHVQLKAIEAEPAMKYVLDQVHNDVVEIKRFVMSEESQRILNWITELDFSRQYNDSLNQRLDGTGIWLLESDEFTRWVSEPQQTLFCPGIPGAGKTVMSCLAVDHLRKTFRDDSDVQIGYLFCSYQPSFQQTILDFQLSLLRQLAVRGSTVLRDIQHMHEIHVRDQTRPDSNEIESQLLRAARSFRRVFVVIDALDEYCSSDPGQLENLLAILFALQKDAPVSILATSRPNSEIMSRFTGCIHREIRAQDNDILTYVNAALPALLRAKIPLYPHVQDNVRRAIVKSADGMFLLAKLHMEHLKGYPTVGELEEALDQLPGGSNRLDSAYEQAITRIESQGTACCEMALRVLSWLAYCKRALTAQELQHALGTRNGKSDLDRRFLPDLDIIDSICAGLVAFDRDSGLLRLVHYTTKEYLLGHYRFREAEANITRTCLTYMSLDAFSTGRPENFDTLEHRRQLYPLHQYCAQYWTVHALIGLDTSAEDLVALITLFLTREPNVQFFSSQTVSISTRRTDLDGLL
ncbi:hypothetical protein BJX99DRAFT_272889 [Aspergillus californicus]